MKLPLMLRYFNLVNDPVDIVNKLKIMIFEAELAELIDFFEFKWARMDAERESLEGPGANLHTLRFIGEELRRRDPLAYRAWVQTDRSPREFFGQAVGHA